MNRGSDQFEPTDGDGYAKWFAAQNSKTNGQLIRVVRLAKYLRDEYEWPIKSILLTTIVGAMVAPTDAIAAFPDVPTALLVLMERVDAYLQGQQKAPEVSNPVLPSEKFTRHWDDQKFKKCKTEIHDVVVRIREAFGEADGEKGGEKWQAVFGEVFPILDEDLEGGQLIEKAELVAGPAAHARPLSDIAQKEALKYAVKLDATIYDKTGKHKFRGANSPARLGSGRAIQFVASSAAPEPYDVYWQVVNTGTHAASENGLRGDFFKGRDLQRKATHKRVNWETTKYTGSHWIECFFVSNGVCVGRSGRFYVNVKNPSF